MTLNFDWAKTAIDFCEKHCAEVWVLTGIILFAPAVWLAPIGIAPLVSQYRPWIGLIFVLTMLVVMARFFRWVSTSWREERAKRTELQARYTRLHALTPEEKTILRAYLENATRTQTLDPRSGVAAGLEAEHVIYKATQISWAFGFDYNIQPWAWTYLHEHPELVSDESTQSAS